MAIGNLLRKIWAAVQWGCLVLLGLNIEKLAESKGWDSILGLSVDQHLPGLYPWITHPAMFAVCGVAVSVWIGTSLFHYFRQRSPMLAAIPESPDAGFFQEDTGRPLNDEQWMDMFAAVEDIRRELVRIGVVPATFQALSRPEQINRVGQMVHQLTTIYGILHPSQLSEPVPPPASHHLNFRVNGLQLDSDNQDGTPSYRYLHIRTAEYPRIKAEAIAYF